MFCVPAATSKYVVRLSVLGAVGEHRSLLTQCSCISVKVFSLLLNLCHMLDSCFTKAVCHDSAESARSLEGDTNSSGLHEHLCYSLSAMNHGPKPLTGNANHITLSGTNPDSTSSHAHHELALCPMSPVLDHVETMTLLPTWLPTSKPLWLAFQNVHPFGMCTLSVGYSTVCPSLVLRVRLLHVIHLTAAKVVGFLDLDYRLGTRYTIKMAAGKGTVNVWYRTAVRGERQGHSWESLAGFGRNLRLLHGHLLQ
jgi:hypothetical protein